MMLSPLNPFCLAVLKAAILDAMHSSHILDEDTENSLIPIICACQHCQKNENIDERLTASVDTPLSFNLACHQFKWPSRELAISLNGASPYAQADHTVK